MAAKSPRGGRGGPVGRTYDYYSLRHMRRFPVGARGDAKPIPVLAGMLGRPNGSIRGEFSGGWRVVVPM